jgi:hypothetical protein
VKTARLFARNVVLLVGAVAFWSVAAHSAVVTDSLIKAVGQIESSGGRFTVGDGGKANGTWQMHSAAWKDVTAFRTRRGLPTWSYSHAHDTTVSRVYARDYLTMLENQLRNALRHEPTAEMIYAAYNMGFSRFESIGFTIERAPRTTQAACARLVPLIATFERDSERTLVRASAD